MTSKLNKRRRFLVAAIFMFGIGAALGAGAQGFPGGGGRFGGRGGMGRHPDEMPHREAPRAQRPADPLVTFFASLRALRMELLVREDQVAAWTAMQDALRAYVESAPQDHDLAIPEEAPPDALQRLAALAADTRRRADALPRVSDRVSVLMKVLDERQRTTFGTRLANAFAPHG